MDKRLLPMLAPLAASLLASAPAAAQNVSPYAVSANAVRKSEALLGVPSRLSALMAAQSGSALPVATAALPATEAVLRSPWSGQSITLRRQAVAAGRPDVFGSVALSIGATPLDARWRSVAARPADAGATRWSASLRQRSEAERIDAVNRFVNARIRFIDDDRQFGRSDVWQSAADSLRRGRGDCEDYAIAKLQLLRAAGFSERDLYLVIVKDLVRRSDHAVLAVHSNGRLWVLDNGTDRVTDAADIVDYRPIFSYSASRRWTHGYRRDIERPVQLASAPVSPTMPVPASGTVEDSAQPLRFTMSAADLSGVLAG